MYLTLKFLHIVGGSFDWPAYEKLSRGWAIWGMVALLTPVLAAALMVLKPTW